MIVKEVEVRILEMVRTFNSIVDKTVKSSKQFDQSEIENFASDLQNNYD